MFRFNCGIDMQPDRPTSHFMPQRKKVSMGTKHLHLARLFKDFATHQQNRLSDPNDSKQNPAKDLLKRLLSRYDHKSDLAALREALLEPYFPLGMIARTIFSDVTGMRFFINKRRPDLEPSLAVELSHFVQMFLQIKRDIETFFNPETITCIPLDGKKHRLPISQWCRMCGTCCQIGGIPPDPPPGIYYPDHWHGYLSGLSADNQQLCPFLFQYFGEPTYFCSIHHIKPTACRTFDHQDCQKRLQEKNLHQ